MLLFPLCFQVPLRAFPAIFNVANVARIGDVVAPEHACGLMA
jgi:hypothetical protein